MAWLKHTTEWTVHDSWYNGTIHMHLKTRVIVTMATLVLVLAPSVLAFFVAVTHPDSGLSCRALTILIYAWLQLVLVFMMVWRDFHSFAVSPEQSRPWWRKASTIIRGIVLGSFFLLAVFTCFAETLMQIMGAYRNCLCDISARYWLHPYETFVSLASDTQDRRNASHGWIIIGFTSMVLVAIICYVGW